MPIWQPPDLKQRIKFRRIFMPNIIAISNIADGKTGLQTDEDTIQFDLTSLINQVMFDDKSRGEACTY
ncbi:MAG: hypothetical protein V7K67_25935 [Nostoc sp.]|uniref:hypothetical protein n=1 Tax=Nostoc sp. TaxID=1180 RepID=UPI002FF07CF7